MDKKQQLDLQKLQLDIEETENDIKLKQLDIQIRSAELESKKRSRNSLSQSLLVAVIGGLFGLFGSVYNSYRERVNAEELERQKLNSSLILKCIQIDDKYKSIEALQLLLNLGLVEDNGNALTKAINDTLKFKSIKTSLDALSTIKVIDTLDKPVGNAEVFYNDLYVGKTDISGKISVGIFNKELPNNEIKVKVRNKEVKEYRAYSVDNRNNITLSVVPY